MASRTLVIDADVLRAAGLKEGRSGAAREVLLAVYKICHRAVVGPELRREWKDHRSGFAASWIATMVAARKCEFSASHNADFQARIIGAASEEKRAIVAKDVHLLDQAQQSDQIVVSFDLRARTAFAGIAQQRGDVASIVWVDPSEDLSELIEWLGSGAKHEIRRTLGRYADDSLATPE